MCPYLRRSLLCYYACVLIMHLFLTTRQPLETTPFGGRTMALTTSKTTPSGDISVFLNTTHIRDCSLLRFIEYFCCFRAGWVPFSRRKGSREHQEAKLAARAEKRCVQSFWVCPYAIKRVSLCFFWCVLML